MSVTVDISHTYRGDLAIALVHAGADALIYQGSGSGRDLRETFTTTAFAGADAAGQWTLRVADNADDDEGKLVSWGLTIEPAADGGDPEPAPGLGGDHSSSPRKAIPDEGRMSDTIEVDSAARLSAVTVNVDIRHTYIGDLTVVLTHGGQQVALHRNSGGGQDDLTRSWTVRNFQGLPAGGAWVLEVSDNAAQDVGELVSWSLEL